MIHKMQVLFVLNIEFLRKLIDLSQVQFNDMMSLNQIKKGVCMETKQLPMIVKFEVISDKIAFVKKELIKILGPTRNEPGCIRYDLHQDIENPHIFMFYEVWDSVDAWKKHDVQPHIMQFRKAIEGSVKQISFNKLTHIHPVN